MPPRPVARPSHRWCHASTTLLDFALITWAIDPALLEQTLPDGFVPEVRDGHAFVSMVPFVDRRFHFRCAPFAPVSCGQVNYRAYVRRGDETGVWFFGTSLDSIFVLLPRVAWRMPWHRDRLRFTSNWSAGGCASYRLEATGKWGGASVSLRGAGRPLPELPAFASHDEARQLVIDPFTGWYDRRDGSGVGRYSVWHEPLELEEAIVDKARCDLFANLGLIEVGARPLWAGVQRSVYFDVHTPPIRE